MGENIRRLAYSTFGSYDHVDADAGEINFSASVEADKCPCCSTPFREFSHASSKSISLHLLLCPACGWWHLHKLHSFVIDNKPIEAKWWELHHAIFSEINLQSPLLSIELLRSHLQRHWGDRIHITAQQAEDLVAAVLKDYYGGEILRLTANANAPDGGIDLLIVSKDGIVKRAVQVKRRSKRGVESIEDVRNFVGAMILSGNSAGAFVTTASRFSKHATRLQQNPHLIKRRLTVDLIDGERLLELLDFTNASIKPALPPSIHLDMLWTGDRGVTLTSSQLLFHDISKL